MSPINKLVRSVSGDFFTPFNVWLKILAYSKWYADKYLQLHIDFDFEDEDT